MALMFNAWLSRAPWLHVGQVAILNTKPLCVENARSLFDAEVILNRTTNHHVTSDTTYNTTNPTITQVPDLQYSTFPIVYAIHSNLQKS